MTACTLLEPLGAPSAPPRTARACSIATRDALGDELEQLDVVRVERARDERADVEHADHARRRTSERHAEQRLDPLLAQDRVEDVGVVDVGEDHRPPLGGDPAREALADRDPDALLDLLLDPDRGARDELVRLASSSSTRSVAVEHRRASDEQRAQQLLELEVRERRIGQRLEAA